MPGPDQHLIHPTRLWTVTFKHPMGKIERPVAADHIADVLAFAAEAIAPLVKMKPEDLTIVGVHMLSESVCPAIRILDAQGGVQ